MCRSPIGTSASTATRLACRDDRDTPFCHRGGMARVSYISEKTKENYFCGKDWTAQIRLKWLTKLISSCTRFIAPDEGRERHREKRNTIFPSSSRHLGIANERTLNGI